MSAQPTPGPWQCQRDEQYADGWEVTAKTDNWRAGGECPDGWFVADVHCDAGSGSSEANARLIAAAPELLEALSTLIGGKCPECKGWGEVSYFGEMVRCKCNGRHRHVATDKQIEAARAAIAKATGQ